MRVDCRGRQEFRQCVRQAGYDVLVSDLGGCDAGLFGLCEEGRGGEREGTRYAVVFFVLVKTHACS